MIAAPDPFFGNCAFAILAKTGREVWTPGALPGKTHGLGGLVEARKEVRGWRWRFGTY